VLNLTIKFNAIHIGVCGVKPDSRLNWLKRTASICATLCPTQLLIHPIFPSMHVWNLMKMRRIPPSLIARRNTKASLAPLDGLFRQLDPTWPRLIPSCQPASTNLPEAISMLPFTSFITFIQRSTTVSHSLWKRELPSTHICPSPTHPITKHMTMHYLPVPTTITI
jgi:hypothetical protein